MHGLVCGIRPFHLLRIPPLLTLPVAATHPYSISTPWVASYQPIQTWPEADQALRRSHHEVSVTDLFRPSPFAFGTHSTDGLAFRLALGEAPHPAPCCRFVWALPAPSCCSGPGSPSLFWGIPSEICGPSLGDAHEPLDGVAHSFTWPAWLH